MQILNNESLISLAGLDNLISVYEYFNIENNSSLLSLEGLGSLSQPGYFYFQIRDNASLVSLSGLNSLVQMSGPLYIVGNDLLENLEGLESITGIAQELNISGNASLINLEGLGNLETIGNLLMIKDNPSLSGLEGLNSLRTINAGLLMEYNYALASLSGLNALDSIGGELKILQCNSLQNLSGLESLRTIGGLLWLEENNALESLTGIDSINSEELEGIRIIYNPQLSECDVESICDFLVGSNENITVYLNGPGCNNSVEIEEACFASADEPEKGRNIFIYCNDSERLLHVICPQDEDVEKIMIYNTLGHLVSEKKVSKILNLSHLHTGIYLAVIATTRGDYYYKFVF
jgi:hypothetical protein